jgi:hypothetical protein
MCVTAANPQVWSLGQPMPNFTLEGHEKGVNCVDYFTGGDRPFLISGADDRMIKVGWKFFGGARVCCECEREKHWCVWGGGSAGGGQGCVEVCGLRHRGWQALPILGADDCMIKVGDVC